MPAQHLEKKKGYQRELQQRLAMKRALFTRVLELKFKSISFTYHQKIKTASLENLITWAGKIETANTLNEVFVSV